MCVAPELPKTKKRNGNFIGFNIRIIRSSLSSVAKRRNIKEFGEMASRAISRIIRVKSPDRRFLMTEGNLKIGGKAQRGAE